MELTILGTAAAEGWPAPFCVCQHCEAARSRRGVNIRTRAGYLLDTDFKIDYGPDTTVQLQQQGLHLAGLRTLVFTHQHQDHVCPEELLWMRQGFSATPPAQPIQVYGNAQVLELMQKAPLSMLELHLLEPLKATTTPQGDEIFPMPADHVEGALLLRITRRGKSLLIGHDSGYFPEETREALAAGPTLDLALLDCTSGGRQTGNRGHMDVEGVTRLTAELRASGAFGPNTQVFATHFSHNGGLLHENLVQRLLPHKIGVTYDGMRLGVTV